MKKRKTPTAILFCLRGSGMQLLICVQILLRLCQQHKGNWWAESGKSINQLCNVCARKSNYLIMLEPRESRGTGDGCGISELCGNLPRKQSWKALSSSLVCHLFLLLFFLQWELWISIKLINFTCIWQCLLCWARQEQQCSAHVTKPQLLHEGNVSLSWFMSTGKSLGVISSALYVAEGGVGRGDCECVRTWVSICEGLWDV